MKNIEKDGIIWYHNPRLEGPKREDFFEVTGEIKFGGMYQDTGHFDDEAFHRASKKYSADSYKKCENKSGYFCKLQKCKYPSCLVER